MDLWYNKNGNVRARRGQAMLEYLLALSGLIVVVAILCVFVATAMRTADRTERLACSEYP